MNSEARGYRPVALVILDGWGLAEPGPGNAVELAETPVFDDIWSRCPTTTLSASGEDVGLPAGQIGNSEVGHLNLGAGRVVLQDLSRIDHAIAQGELDRSPVLTDALAKAVASQRTVHVLGLTSRGGVHSQLDHIVMLCRVAANAGVHQIAVHAITDGRDVSPDASLTDMPSLEESLRVIATDTGVDARVASVCGRYWAMDRDNRWDRTQRAWELYVRGTAPGAMHARSATDAVITSQSLGITDEFVEPHTVGEPVKIADGDLVICANFRPDRMRQIVRAFIENPFDRFRRSIAPACDVITMTSYEDDFDVPVIFGPHNVDNTLADVIEDHGIKQLHAAETEKYAHVTYFFNGGVETEHQGEIRDLVQSPRDVKTYDQKPEMSAEGVADEVCRDLADPKVGFAVINFANPDMVGHTGVIEAAVTACEKVDVQLGRVLDAVLARGGAVIVTADHGNAEQMLTPEGKPHTAHTTNPVPLVLVTANSPQIKLRNGGKLADVAPTVLDLLGIAQPSQMSGKSLLFRIPSIA